MTTTKKSQPRKSVAARKSAESKAKVADVAKRSAQQHEPETAIDASTPQGEADRTSAAIDEKRALSAWIKGGKKGKRPSTLNLDAIDADYKLLGSRSTRGRSKSKGDGTRGRKPLSGGAALRFVVDGKPIIDRHNRLAGISRVTGRNGGKKLSTDQFRALLVKSGIAEPDSSTWKFKLPNGVVVESKKDTPELRAQSTAKTSSNKSAAKKQTTKGTPASARVQRALNPPAAKRSTKSTKKAQSIAA